ncbi:lysoplasmalogenase [Schumannella soli]|uniref:Lysoplasmalogenase n=1 Tax=Schumannella soli TaxID=2590779 RepID=A0A506Y547_9MICO|nr:lysoplasmalogenase [Schumannella soli]TPW76148.1 lysoplasmalogenase [Schumannella soli]
MTDRPSSRIAVLSFLPFAVIAIVHVASKLPELAVIDSATKPLLMPMLALPIIVIGRRGRILPLVLLLAGVLFSWIGDVTIGDLPVGLGFFLLAHVAYLAMMFVAYRHRLSWWALAYPAWWVALLVLLAPYLGGMLIPLAVYGLALGGMAAVATRGSVVLALGGASFVASDSLLAGRLFVPGLLEGPLSDAVIMALYLLAQALLVAASLRHEARRGTRSGLRHLEAETV